MKIFWWNTIPVQMFRAGNRIQLHKCGEVCICFAQFCPCDWCVYVNALIDARSERIKVNGTPILSR